MALNPFVFEWVILRHFERWNKTSVPDYRAQSSLKTRQIIICKDSAKFFIVPFQQYFKVDGIIWWIKCHGRKLSNQSMKRIYVENHSRNVVLSIGNNIFLIHKLQICQCKPICVKVVNTLVWWSPPRGFREQGNWNIDFLGAGDVFKLFSGNKGTLE